MVETEEFDEAIGAAIGMVDLDETLIAVTADHSHVFNIAGYPLRPKNELPYEPTSFPTEWLQGHSDNLFNVVFDISGSTGEVRMVGDTGGVPYTTLVYGNGPGYRGAMNGGSRVNPFEDAMPGYDGKPTFGPNDPQYLQEAAIPLFSETHSAEEVAIYAIGAGSMKLNGTVKNTFCFELMKMAGGF